MIQFINTLVGFEDSIIDIHLETFGNISKHTTTTTAVHPRFHVAGLVQLSHLLFVFGTKPFEKAGCCLWACCAWAITWTRRQWIKKGNHCFFYRQLKPRLEYRVIFPTNSGIYTLYLATSGKSYPSLIA